MPPPATRRLIALLAALLSLVAVGCSPAPGTAANGTAPTDAATDPATVLTEEVAAGLPRLRPVVVGTLPHDTESWTQGLEIAGDALYEGTGLVGRSRLRELDPATGQLRRDVAVPDNLYGEGLTVLGDRIWQLTWRDGVVLQWDRAATAIERRLPWAGEGWGLCHTDDGRVVASDGSDRLRVLAGDDLVLAGTVRVRAHGRPVGRLNELECVPGAVWANVYQTDWLVRVDLASGAVTEAVDAAGLLPEDQRGAADVLNGIAAVPGTDQFLLTGKLWPTLFRVRFAG